MKLKSIIAIAVALAVLPSLVFAQTTGGGMMGKLKGMMAAHKGGMHGTMGGHKGHKHGMMGGMHMGKIVGDKNTHVYHLPGSGGMMPSAANSVYFMTVGQAEAAGYHAAGSGGKMGHGHGMKGHGKGHMGMMGHGKMHKGKKHK